MYDLGEGGHVNKALARKLYAQAAERGHLLASVNLYASSTLLPTWSSDAELTSNFPAYCALSLSLCVCS